VTVWFDGGVQGRSLPMGQPGQSEQLASAFSETLCQMGSKKLTGGRRFRHRHTKTCDAIKVPRFC
jgi:hypothetical protein